VADRAAILDLDKWHKAAESGGSAHRARFGSALIVKPADMKRGDPAETIRGDDGLPAEPWLYCGRCNATWTSEAVAEACEGDPACLLCGGPLAPAQAD
jgi:hypothetical protein